MKIMIQLLFLLFTPLLSAFAFKNRKDRPSARLTLAERLGFSKEDRILIVNGDDVGMSHASNAATIDAMEHGLMTSGSIMVACPWFPEIADYAVTHPQADFGIHLLQTSEWKHYRWGPVASKTDVPGLVDPQGYLWRDVRSVYKYSTPEQAYVEARAQIQKALASGVDITHLDSHMGAMHYNEQYFQMYRRLANEFRLPVRMASQEQLEEAGAGHQREQLDRDGIIYPDYLIHNTPEPGETTADFWPRIIGELKPGVTELFIHAALESEEMKKITPLWKNRALEHRLFTTDPEMRRLLDEQGVKRIGFRMLRDLQRESRLAESDLSPTQ